MNNKVVVLAAGGTGGHVFPALALADEIEKRGYKPILITDKRSAKNANIPNNLDVIVINSSSTAGNPFVKLTALIKIFTGFIRARKLLKKLRPYAVVGFGGYPSFPTMAAAKFIKTKKFIHEQNAYMGRVNRFISPFIDSIATSFERIAGISKLEMKKIVFTGNPVRSSIRAIRAIPYNKIKEGEAIHILVTGGSQGARFFSEVVPEALQMLTEEIRNRIRIDQQCREEDIIRVRQIYEEYGVHANLATFFDDMPTKIAATHLVIARAGASTVSELMVAGRPAILIPFIYAKDDHQTLNAKQIAEKDAVIYFAQQRLTADILSKKIKELIEQPELLSDMAENAHNLGVVDATERLADLVFG